MTPDREARELAGSNLEIPGPAGSGFPPVDAFTARGARARAAPRRRREWYSGSPDGLDLRRFPFRSEFLFTRARHGAHLFTTLDDHAGSPDASGAGSGTRTHPRARIIVAGPLLRIPRSSEKAGTRDEVRAESGVTSATGFRGGRPHPSGWPGPGSQAGRRPPGSGGKTRIFPENPGFRGRAERGGKRRKPQYVSRRPPSYYKIWGGQAPALNFSLDRGGHET